jgi:hypothetical protein
MVARPVASKENLMVDMSAGEKAYEMAAHLVSA